MAEPSAKRQKTEDSMDVVETELEDAVQTGFKLGLPDTPIQLPPTITEPFTTQLRELEASIRATNPTPAQYNALKQLEQLYSQYVRQVIQHILQSPGSYKLNSNKETIDNKEANGIANGTDIRTLNAIPPKPNVTSTQYSKPVIVATKQSSTPPVEQEPATEDSQTSSSNPASSLLELVDSDDEKKTNRRGRFKFPPDSVKVLKDWLIQNAAYPYPTEEQKQQLAAAASLSVTQVCTWFTNKRRKWVKKIRSSGGTEYEKFTFRQCVPSSQQQQQQQQSSQQQQQQQSPQATQPSRQDAPAEEPPAAQLPPPEQPDQPTNIPPFFPVAFCFTFHQLQEAFYRGGLPEPSSIGYKRI